MAAPSREPSAGLPNPVTEDEKHRDFKIYYSNFTPPFYALYSAHELVPCHTCAEFAQWRGGGVGRGACLSAAADAQRAGR